MKNSIKYKIDKVDMSVVQCLDGFLGSLGGEVLPNVWVALEGIYRKVLKTNKIVFKIFKT